MILIYPEESESMKRENLRWLSLLLTLLMVPSIVSIAFAPITLPTVLVDPPTIMSNVGGSITVNVNIQGVVDLFSYELKLGFNPGILAVTSVTEGPFIITQTTSPMGTYFVTSTYSSFIYVACVTLGRYPGVSGSGTLVTMTFDVIEAGTVDLDLYDIILLDSTGTLINYNISDGYFYTAESATVLGKSAWPEHHHFVVSKDDGYQTLYAKVKNLGPTDLNVKVMFDIMRDDAFVTTIESGAAVVPPETTVVFTADLPLTAADAGKYYATATAWYSFYGINFASGAKNKTFSFAVVP